MFEQLHDFYDLMNDDPMMDLADDVLLFLIDHVEIYQYYNHIFSNQMVVQQQYV